MYNTNYILKFLIIYCKYVLDIKNTNYKLIKLHVYNNYNYI